MPPKRVRTRYVPDPPEEATQLVCGVGDLEGIGDGAPSLELALTEGPAAGDQVVEEGGARALVEPAAAPGLGGASPLLHHRLGPLWLHQPAVGTI